MGKESEIGYISDFRHVLYHSEPLISLLSHSTAVESAARGESPMTYRNERYLTQKGENGMSARSSNGGGTLLRFDV